MNDNVLKVLEEWSFPLWINLALLLPAVVYVRGWLNLRHRSPELIPIGHLAAFLAGVFSVWIAIGSPLAAFDDVSLSVHMMQHLLLMSFAPPLLWLGAPALPLLHGLPEGLVRGVLGPLLRWKPVQNLGHFLGHPVTCWLAASVALLAWHAPAAFGLALGSEVWHEVEHTCFFATSLLFWWPVIQPYPSEPIWPPWTIPVYLFFGMMPCGVLGAFLCFSDSVVYPAYTSAPNVFGLTPLNDQVFAGALMWVFGTFVYLLPAVIVTTTLLSPQTAPAGDPRLSPREAANHPA
jgi:putative membrane protein